MKILFISILLAVSVQAQQPLTVVNSASYVPQNKVGNDSIASIFGTNLAPTSATSNSQPLATTLVGVQVTLYDGRDNYECGLFYVAPTQINFHVPYELASGNVTVNVIRNGAVTHSSVIQVTNPVPALFYQTVTPSPLKSAIGTLNVYGNGSVTYTNTYYLDSAGTPRLQPFPYYQQGQTFYLIIYGTGLRNSSLPVENFVVTNLSTNVTTRLPLDYTGNCLCGNAGLDQVNVKLSDTTHLFLTPGTYSGYLQYMDNHTYTSNVINFVAQ